MKNIVFDLFDTILDKISFDYFKGLEYLYLNYYKNIISFDELKSSAEEFRSIYMMDRKTTKKEIPFVKQLLWFEEKYPSVRLIDKDEIEWQFFKSSREEAKAPNIEYFLEYMRKWGFKIFILSNSIFSNKTLKKYLDEFGLLSYFDNVYSSADIIDRKPSLEAFRYVINEENIDFEEPTFFVGNSLEKDISPSTKLGFISILRNHLNETYNGISFYDYKDLLEFFEKNYIFYNSIMDDLSTVDGPGNRTVVFLQGCLAHCIGCHNEQSWDLKASKIMGVIELADILKNKAIKKRITITGGEPLLQEKALLKLFEALDGYELCLYTGYDFENVSNNLLKYLTYIKVGRFIKELRDVSIPYIGSSNQKLIKLKG